MSINSHRCNYKSYFSGNKFVFHWNNPWQGWGERLKRVWQIGSDLDIVIRVKSKWAKIAAAVIQGVTFQQINLSFSKTTSGRNWGRRETIIEGVAGWYAVSKEMSHLSWQRSPRTEEDLFSLSYSRHISVLFDFLEACNYKSDFHYEVIWFSN